MTTRRDRLILCLASHIPPRLLNEPERLFLAAGCVVIGLDATIVDSPGSPMHVSASLLRIEFGLSFLIGGLFVLLGIQRWRWLGRLGKRIIVVGCGLFIYAALAHGGARAIPEAVLYVGIAITYGLRLLGGSALLAQARRELDQDDGR